MWEALNDAINILMPIEVACMFLVSAIIGIESAIKYLTGGRK